MIEDLATRAIKEYLSKYFPSGNTKTEKKKAARKGGRHFKKDDIAVRSKGCRGGGGVCAICGYEKDLYYAINRSRSRKIVGVTICIDCLREVYMVAERDNKSLYDVAKLMKDYMRSKTRVTWEEYYKAHIELLHENKNPKALQKAHDILKSQMETTEKTI